MRKLADLMIFVNIPSRETIKHLILCNLLISEKTSRHGPLFLRNTYSSATAVRSLKLLLLGLDRVLVNKWRISIVEAKGKQPGRVCVPSMVQLCWNFPNQPFQNENLKISSHEILGPSY